MRALPKPADLQPSLFETCAAKLSAPSSALLLHQAVAVAARRAAYIDKGQVSALFELPHAATAAPLTKSDYSSLYKNVLLRQERDRYDIQKQLAVDGCCPLCGTRTVRTLDHYLPIHAFCDLAVVPENLIPACRDCNSDKHTHAPASYVEQLFHPFFDDWSNVSFLRATVHVGGGVRVSFDVNPQANWTNAEKDRATFHLNKLKLPELYSVNAGNELSGTKSQFSSVWDQGGPVSLATYLQSVARSWQRLPNSWQHATYSALAQSQSFIDGGFQQIGIL